MISNYLLISANLYRAQKKKHIVFIDAAIIWTLLIYLLSFVLSAFHSLKYSSLAIIYIVVNAALIFNLYRNKQLFLLIKNTKAHIKLVTGYIFDNKISACICIGLLLYMFGLGIVACMAVPYSYDALTYHAPRICQWVQNESVFYYASHIIRQNISTVLGAYISLFVYILSGCHPGAMCVAQYVAYVINLLMILYVCTFFGVRRRIKEIIAVLWVTMPIVFAEAITPQNDILAASWLLMFVIVILDIISDMPDNGLLIRYIVRLAFIISFAYLTKPAVCFAFVVFLIWYLCVCIKRKYSFGYIILQCVIALCIILLLIAPQMIQNYIATGAISADDAGKNQLVATVHPAYLLLNLGKNIIYNFAIKIGPIDMSKLIVPLMYGIAALFRIDLDYEPISEGGFTYKYPSLPSYGCDSALQTTVTILAFISFLIFLRRKKNISSLKKNYIFCAYFSLILLCVFLRWEVSINRYMIGYFAILLIGIAIIAEEFFLDSSVSKFKIYVLSIFTAILILGDISGELIHLIKIHPVFPVKSSLTLYNNRLNDYKSVCDRINEDGVNVLGIIESECGIEYPIWLMINETTKVVHVNLEDNDIYQLYEETEIVPNAIISEYDYSDELMCHDNNYIRTIQNDYWSLYELSK